VTEWILARGPEPISDDLGSPGYSLLHAAVEWDAPEVAAVALAHGADPTIRDGTWNGTPLGWAEHTRRQTSCDRRSDGLEKPDALRRPVGAHPDGFVKVPVERSRSCPRDRAGDPPVRS
jgi:hypothetical protein